jgi:hypothetical protein
MRTASAPTIPTPPYGKCVAVKIKINITILRNRIEYLDTKDITISGYNLKILRKKE